MLTTISVILFLLWALSWIAGITLGGFIHLLFAFAIVLAVVRILHGDIEVI